MNTRKISGHGSVSRCRNPSLSTALGSNPVQSLCDRLGEISRHLNSSRPGAAQLIHLHRMVDTAEALLYMPRASPVFDESIAIAQETAIQSGRGSSTMEGVASQGTQTLSNGFPNLDKLDFKEPTENDMRSVPTPVLASIHEQLTVLKDEMLQRVQESQRFGDLVADWVREMKAVAAANHEQSLAELRYLQHKLERLDERTASLTLGSSESLRSKRRSAATFREPVTAELIETIGIPPRFSSLPSPSNTMASKANLETLAKSQHDPVRTRLCGQHEAIEQHQEGHMTREEFSTSPSSIRHRFARARKESAEIEEAIVERREVINKRLESWILPD